MSSLDEFAKLVENARQGEKDSLDRLADAARVRLQEYVFRLTLEQDLTQDIVQETILEMFKVFEKLKRGERFWPWLYGIATNKLRNHYGRQWRHKTLSLAGAGEIGEADGRDGLADAVTREFKQIVLKSMDELQPRHRAVLTMRCYDEMAYSEIAKVMGCSEFGARAVFCRAKKALAKRLGGYGLGRSSLLIVLGVFGKITATSEAAAANVSVTAATLKVGLTASLAATATSKTAIVTLVAAGVIGGGSVAMVSSLGGNDAGAPQVKTQGLLDVQQQGAEAFAGVQECWHFFPEGPGKPLMMRLMESDSGGGVLNCRYLQNQHANYYYDGVTVTINNYRCYNADLSVRRLPTDGSELRDFISRVEGHRGGMEYVADSRKGLLVVLERNAGDDRRVWRVDRHEAVLEEQYFQTDWPASVKITDNRDAMHKRGWTWFRLSGQINGEEVAGTGRVPFVYEAIAERYPWLDISVGNRLRIVDTGAEAGVCDSGGKIVARYEGGSFFEGLARPWMGLHTIDMVRRDAGGRKVWFETKHGAVRGKAEVVLTFDAVKLVYEIDLGRDVIDRITFFEKSNGEQDAMGEVRFSYLQEIPPTSGDFATPRPTSSAGRRWDRLGTFWLAKLAGGGW